VIRSGDHCYNEGDADERRADGYMQVRTMLVVVLVVALLVVVVLLLLLPLLVLVLVLTPLSAPSAGVRERDCQRPLDADRGQPRVLQRLEPHSLPRLHLGEVGSAHRAGGQGGRGDALVRGR